MAATEDLRHRQDLLYACFSEAESANNKDCAIDSLKSLVEQWSEDAPPCANLPLFLRCTIRLILAPDNDQKEFTEHCNMLQDAEYTCQIFEIGTYSRCSMKAIS